MGAEDDYIKALIEDAAGQVTEAMSREVWYTKWGMHYLPSLCFAHQLQQCNNFKDPGVQQYGGDFWADLCEQADAIFVGLPPPQPGKKLAPTSSGSTAMTTVPQTGA